MSHPQKPTDIGMNRTGLATSPLAAKKAKEAAKQATGDQPPDASALRQKRQELSEKAPPVGTMPPPGSLKGAVKSAAEALKGHHPNAFLDKLGERLAFERTGVRLYDALLAKIPPAATGEGTLTLASVRRQRDEELDHLFVVKRALEQLGADPTVITPCADLAGVQAQGLVQVMSDPRTTLTQCLDALLTAELADNDGWRILIAMARAAGKDDLATEFGRCLAEEDEHLANVRAWVSERLELQLGAAFPRTGYSPPAPAP